MKGKMKRRLSYVLAAVTLLTSAVQPMAVSAAEPDREKPPLYEEVKDQLAADEVVTASDLTVEFGSVFDVKADFTGIEIPDESKVKVSFEEAKNADGKDFDTSYADTYEAVYYVEPQTTNHPTYQISRKLTVAEPSSEAKSAESHSPDEGGQGSGEEDAEESEPEPETAVSMETGMAEPETDIKEPEIDKLQEESVKELEASTEQETLKEEIQEETETEADEPETEDAEDGAYQVTVSKGKELQVSMDHEDGRYDAGEQVTFTTDLPEGSLVAVAALKENANKEEQTADILYAEVSSLDNARAFSFEMPADDIALEVAVDQQDMGIMMLAANANPWDDATEVEANKYYYYSDGTLHPFNSVMGSGGNDSYKYVRYKVNGKTYTAYAYCMQHSMPSPPSGTTYGSMIELDEKGDDKYLRKAFFYGYGGPGWGGTFNGYNIKKIMTDAGCTSEMRAMQHYLVDYLYDGESGFGGALSETAKTMLKNIKSALSHMPDPTGMSLLPGLSVTADGTKTETFTWKANEAFTITIHLEDGVSLVNETTGKRSTGNATVKGGEKFHLEATSGDISKLKGKYAITSNYPLDFHGMLLKLEKSQDIGFGYYTDSDNLELTVDWPEQATVEIVKKDAVSNAKIAGAVYGIYSDEAGTKLIAQMPPTDQNGASSVTLDKTQDKVYLKEISVPAGYILDAKSYGVDLVVGKTTKKEVTNREQFANLTVYKEGEELTGAAVTGEGVVFQYTIKRQKGAVFNVYAGADIVAADGTVVLKQGALVKEGLVTGEDGSATLEKLHLGTYVITETKAPDNLICKGESKTVTLSYAGQNVEVAVGDTTFVNDRQKAEASVVKVDGETQNPLVGGVYGLYAADDIRSADGNVIVPSGTLIEKATTGSDGKAVYKADLPINHEYSIKEEQAPNLYLRNQEDVYFFTFGFTNDKEAVVKFSHTFSNKRVNAEISLVKKDAETGVAQGDATLEGAVYGLYAREDIAHPDGKTGVIYPAGTKIAELVTDKDGKAKVENLYLGKYYIKEIRPSEGYLLDETEHDLDCAYEGDLVATVKKETVSLETVMKQPFQIIKAANNGKTDADLLKGAGFTAYLVSSLQVKADGSYDFDNASPVIIGENGATEIFTDEKGHAVSIPIPYGTYVVRETTTPHNYKPVDDFIVKITENHPGEPQIWRVLLDEEFKAKLKIIKKDDETKKSVLLPGTEFKVYDLANKKYVEQVTTYPTTVVHKSYFTDGEGYLILPNNLKIGKYRIEEVTAPDGYTVNKDYVEIAVDSNTAYHTNSVSGDLIIEADYENHPVKGQLTVEKSGEVLVSYDGDFHYKEAALSDAVFEVYASEDIYTPDHQKDEDGNRILIYAKGSFVTTATTDETGKAVIENLPLGKYTVKEKTAPKGFVLNTVPQDVTFAYEGQDTPVVEETVSFTNDRQKVELSVVKKDAENGSVLSGAVFGLYNQSEIVSGDKVVVEADTLLQKVTSGEDGKAAFTLDLPLGQYYVKELKAPAGYVSSDEVLLFDASYQGQDVPAVVLEAEKKNEPTTFEFTKSDFTTGVELSGAALTVLDAEGNVVDTWTSVKDEPHVLKRLTVGETYTLREEFAPFGYLKATDVTFVVEDTAEVQKVEMKDEVPTALLIINKKGEFLDKITLLDKVGGFFSHLFEYVSGSLSDVTFDVYAAEDIKAADGISEDYFKADELVGTITTDENGIAKMEGLPAGRYYVKEAETAHGFVLDGEPRYVDLSYRDQDTPVITYEEAWQNNRQKVSVHVSKKEKDTERFLEGCVIALFTREDIVSAKGELLMKADTMIEVKATDAEGNAEFVADLPVDGKYYVKEIAAPDGFTNTGEEFDFTFDYAGQEQTEVGFEFLFENEPTTVEFSKKSLTTGEELPGAHLQLTDSEGAIVEEWVSTEEAHIIKELVVGEEYTLTETIPATGYVTAESITFVVEDTAEIQKVEMKDDVTKVEISKTDITTGKELPGAELTILDENGKEVEKWKSTDKPHYIEKLPVGKYTLREVTAPDGYLVAEDVAFEVTDTAEIHKVEMKDQPKPVEDTPQTPATPDTPKTGDNRNIGLWLLLCLLGAGGAGGSMIYLKRKKRN